MLALARPAHLPAPTTISATTGGSSDEACPVRACAQRTERLRTSSRREPGWLAAPGSSSSTHSTQPCGAGGQEGSGVHPGGGDHPGGNGHPGGGLNLMTGSFRAPPLVPAYVALVGAARRSKWRYRG